MIKPYNKVTVFSWSIYDFANQPFTTLIVTFIYGTFFTQVIAENEIVGTMLWSRGITITAIIVALLSPIMGAVADRGGYRKLYLILWTWASIIGALLLWYPQEGQVIFALCAFVFGFYRFPFWVRSLFQVLLVILINFYWEVWQTLKKQVYIFLHLH